MADWHRKDGDTAPPLAATLEQDGNTYDLTGASVDIVVGSRRDPPLIDAACTITDAAAGAVEYQFAAGDLDDAAGTYAVEFVVTDSSGDELTFPSDGYMTLTVRQAVQR